MRLLGALLGRRVFAAVAEVDQGRERPGETVVAPDQDDVDPSSASQLEELSVSRPVVVPARRPVDELSDHAETASLRILAEHSQLVLRVLALVRRRDAGVNPDSFLWFCRHGRGVTKGSLN